MNKLAPWEQEIFHRDDEVPTIFAHGQMRINLPTVSSKDLPFISILTITRDRIPFFALPLYNWQKFIYPTSKIEWIIVDGSEHEDLKELLPSDPRIKYYHIKELPLGQKRNYGAERCQGPIIVHMDDDDYYFPDSLLAKAQVFMCYPKKGVIYSMPLGCYDLRTNSSQLADTILPAFPEASFAYRKSFWEESPFREPKGKRGNEGYYFTYKRRHRCINLPTWFNMVSLTHGKNFTGVLRELDPSEIEQKAPNFYSDVWDQETRDIIDLIRRNNDIE